MLKVPCHDQNFAENKWINADVLNSLDNCVVMCLSMNRWFACLCVFCSFNNIWNRYCCPKLQQIEIVTAQNLLGHTQYVPHTSISSTTFNIQSFMLLQKFCVQYFRYEFHMFRLFISVNRPNLTFGLSSLASKNLYLKVEQRFVFTVVPLLELLLLLLLPCDSARAQSVHFISFHFVWYAHFIRL